MVEFPVSQVETWWWLPAVVAFVVSTLTATGGLSGAFLMLPFQVSVLGFTGPGASPTNLFFNVVAIPSGVYRYHRERRMLWPLAWAIAIGALPGMAAGALVRVYLLPDPASFKPFAGIVLLFIGMRLLRDVVRRNQGAGKSVGEDFQVSGGRLSATAVSYRFMERKYSISTSKVVWLSLLVGVAGGAYGIGGGAVIVPFLVSVFGLPVYTVAGAGLFSTFVGSVFGVIVYWLIDISGMAPGVTASPDLLLGLSLGIGGAAGMYLGARLQRYLPARLIKILLTAFLLFVAARYVAVLF